MESSGNNYLPLAPRLLRYYELLLGSDGNSNVLKDILADEMTNKKKVAMQRNHYAAGFDYTQKESLMVAEERAPYGEKK